MVELEEFKKLEKEAEEIHLKNPELVDYKTLSSFGYVLERIEDERRLSFN